jgi:hypothetical protein
MANFKTNKQFSKVAMTFYTLNQQFASTPVPSCQHLIGFVFVVTVLEIEPWASHMTEDRAKHALCTYCSCLFLILAILVGM